MSLLRVKNFHLQLNHDRFVDKTRWSLTNLNLKIAYDRSLLRRVLERPFAAHIAAQMPRSLLIGYIKERDLVEAGVGIEPA